MEEWIFEDGRADYGETKVEFVENFRKKTKQLSIDVVKFCKKLPRDTVNYVIVNQLVKSATSVGANYRSACRARSKKEFFSKICVVVEEADETQFWLEVIRESEIDLSREVTRLHGEATEILAVVTKAKDNSYET
jgi:four helix bundle protein